ncbi:MAG: hypothetical protein N3A66_07355 [Planctomycetota bacterium]|nr:hypothetical protein [Planctomycetota bacterium]
MGINNSPPPATGNLPPDPERQMPGLLSSAGADCQLKATDREAAASSALTRRQLLIRAGRAIAAAALAVVTGHVLRRALFSSQDGSLALRKIWQIDPDRCAFCELCARACVQKPSAVKAYNDQTLCSNCVVCYGHIANWNAASDQIDIQPTICPQQALRRRPLAGGAEGYFLYEVIPERCNGCGRCAKECNRYGSRSLFLFIRPDLCLGCNECAIARVCPTKAIAPVFARAVLPRRHRPPTS